MFIEFEVNQTSWVTHAADPEDRWDRDSTDGDVSIHSAKLVSEQSYDSLPAPDDVDTGSTIYLVWAKYGTGDSFGSDGGKYELLEMCLSQEEADKRAKYYENVRDYSVPWHGYFEWLDGVYIERFTL